jgi:hypothetical protein
VQVNRGDHLLLVDAELLGRSIDDALVGLVRHEPVEVAAVIVDAWRTASTRR